ncbi:unnamed protein product [Chironomus riparius]|uniref:Dynein regulatory complex protein 10 n=1 Tax=Chironomus riparius TaxID=315576 RepID=A0A9N9RL99_9DIPT|nr:unnamed protein product [Chironomus riparius]
MQLSSRVTKFNEKCNLRKDKIFAIDCRQEKFKHFIAIKIEDEIYDGNMRIVLKSKIRKDAEQNSNFVEKKSQNEYLKLFDSNLVKHKNLVEQKFKAEQTLKAIVLKFDSNVGSRVAEIESIEGDINDNTQNFVKWKLLIAQQEANYVSLMKEKEEEELKYRNQKLEELRINHAAKVIQISWKKYKVKKRKAKKQNKSKHAKNNAPKRTR